ncbi:MAG: LuxR C-terminal-related transcriptional regulator [Clostridia bacterium]|nr:LuxR C-terminal-related transcriptional regulator [Clostridia bacterium]
MQKPEPEKRSQRRFLPVPQGAGRETLYTGVALCVYVLVFLRLARFDFTFLFDGKMAAAVLCGTLLLSAAGWRKGVSLQALRGRVAYNAMIAGYLSAFLFFFSALSKSRAFDPYVLAMSLRPIFYGFLLYVLVKAGAADEPEAEKTTRPIRPADADALRDILRGLGLSVRESDVGVLLCFGFSNAEIAQRLYISESTVKKHATACYAKLNVTGRKQFKSKILESLRQNTD